jgi:hypothetical protein
MRGVKMFKKCETCKDMNCEVCPLSAGYQDKEKKETIKIIKRHLQGLTKAIEKLEKE